MKKFLTALMPGGLLLSMGMVFADQHEGEAMEPNIATPLEMFACKYNEGKDAADANAVIKKFNAWADKQGIKDYAAWTLVPYYSSSEQDFDVLWLGTSEKAKTLGRIQDNWLATGGPVADMFAELWSCDTHAAFSVLRMKQPPKRDNPSNIVISFSDCNTMGDTTFDDLYMPLIEWGKYMEQHGSKSGMWVFFPTYGGGGEEFDFKFVDAFQNLEDLGADWDHMNEKGWQKANELFAGKVRCDSSRSYLATSRRMADETEE